MAESHSNQIKERQITVDPISLIESSRREPSFNVMLPAPDISCSLPNSACSSPRFSFTLLKKKSKNESHASHPQIDRLAHRHSCAVADEQDEVSLRRSKSCADGRPSTAVDELDFLFTKPNTIQFNTNKEDVDRVKNEEEFKCSALCIYLPGFGKGKPVRSKKEQGGEVIISRTVSLEKFECGSWASSAITNDHEGDGGYFDLPLELIQSNSCCSGNDAINSPVSAAFIFDNKDRKGVLKNGSSRRTEGRKSSCESSRHVRFSFSNSSPSSPSCITPRLRKARDDFNAFLEAQTA